jgi:hypothetical protein
VTKPLRPRPARRADTTNRKAAGGLSRDLSARSDAVALEPPRYGIDFVDGGAATAAVQRVAGTTQLEPDTEPEEEYQEEIEEEIEDEAENADEETTLQGRFAPGQERHLPHEAWHVVQQRRGWIKPALREKRQGAYPAQAKFDPGGKTYAKADDPQLGATNAASYQVKANDYGFPAEACVVAMDSKGPGSSTADLFPKGFEEWFDLRVLLDQTQSKVQTLTKMHAINSHLYGPNRVENIFLGNASSNDYHSEKVEEPIKGFVGHSGGETRYAKYRVTPQYNIDVDHDHYNMKLASSMAEDEQLTAQQFEQFKAWAKHAIPTALLCEASYYKESDAGAWSEATERDQETFRTDLSTFVKTIGWSKSKKKKPKGPWGRNFSGARRKKTRSKIKRKEEAYGGRKTWTPKKSVRATRVINNQGRARWVPKLLPRKRGGSDDKAS